MKFLKIIILFLAIASNSCTPQQQNTITDLISPVNLKEDAPTKLILGDLFYAENYKVEFILNANFNVSIDSIKNSVEITPLKNFSGLDLISFKHYDKTYELPVKLERRNKYLFTYKPEGNTAVINLFGQFNGWNRENLPMKDEDEDGTYVIMVPLDPGRYEYKFYVDGAELIDHDNPVKVPNGMGDFNSVRVIEKTTAGKNYLHILNYNQNSNTFSYTLSYESITRDLITNKYVVALLDNFKIEEEKVKLDGNKITISLNSDELEGEKVIRVAVSKNGKATNFQTIRVINGIPLGKENFESWYDAIIYSIMLDRFNDG